MRERHWRLNQLDLFSKLAPEHLREIESHCRSKEFAAGSMVSLPRESSQYVFLLLSGLVKMSRFTADGKESILGYVAPGELFGELAMVGGTQQEDYVQTVESSTIVMVPADRIQKLVATNADLAVSVTRFVGIRRHRIERRLMNLLFASNRDRLVHLLLDLAEQFGVDSDGEVRLKIRLSHQDLANLIGSTRESVTIVLGQLKSEGLIKTGRQQVTLSGPRRLAESVHRRAPRVPVESPMLRPARYSLAAY